MKLTVWQKVDVKMSDRVRALLNRHRERGYGPGCEAEFSILDVLERLEETDPLFAEVKALREKYGDIDFRFTEF